MKNYYVYVYLNPLKSGLFTYKNLVFTLEPFYVGKGKSLRLEKHFKNCLNIKDKKGYKRLFYQKLRKLLKSGAKPVVVKYKENLSEKEAFEVEIELISKIGRRVVKEGPLCNNSKGGEGPSGAIRLKNKIYVFNNEGVQIDVCKNIDECSEKFKIPKLFIYKSCLNYKKRPKNGLRFKKEFFPNIEPYFKIKAYKNRTLDLFDIKDNFLENFKSVSEAAKSLNIIPSAIRNNLVGLSKTCKTKKYGKCKFKYKTI